MTFADGTPVSPATTWDGDEREGTLDSFKTRLGRLRLVEQFAYVFDLGDNWQHLCTVVDGFADPLGTLGIIPDRPLPWWGWGNMPGQYGRDWNGDSTGTATAATPRHQSPLRARTAHSNPLEDRICYRDLIT